MGEGQGREKVTDCPSSAHGSGLLPLRAEDQFLHAPVVHVGDIQRVVRRARDSVRPIRLADVVTRDEDSASPSGGELSLPYVH